MTREDTVNAVVKLLKEMGWIMIPPGGNIEKGKKGFQGERFVEVLANEIGKKKTFVYECIEDYNESPEVKKYYKSKDAKPSLIRKIYFSVKMFYFFSRRAAKRIWVSFNYFTLPYPTNPSNHHYRGCNSIAQTSNHPASSSLVYSIYMCYTDYSLNYTKILLCNYSYHIVSH